MNGVRGRSRRVDLRPGSDSRASLRTATAGGREAQELLRRFRPPRVAKMAGADTRRSPAEVLDLLLASPFAPGHSSGMSYRRRALRGLVEWLHAQPGETWQQRWMASGADTWGNVAWGDPALTWLRAEGSVTIFPMPSTGTSAARFGPWSAPM